MTASGSHKALKKDQTELIEIRKKGEIGWALARHDMILGQSLFGPPIDNTELFLYDNWRNYKGLQYLAGILYLEGPEKDEVDRGDISKIVTLMREVYITGGGSEHVANALIDRYAKLCRIWESGNHPEYNPPLFYIEWAISKSYVIPWEHNVAQLEWILPPEKRSEYPLFAQVVAAYRPQAKRAEKTLNPPSDDWPAKAREIADEFFDNDTRNNSRDSLKGYSTRVMEEMQKRGIKGPRGIIDNYRTIMRDALQGAQWWANKPK